MLNSYLGKQNANSPNVHPFLLSPASHAELNLLISRIEKSSSLHTMSLCVYSSSNTTCFQPFNHLAPPGFIQFVSLVLGTQN